MHDWQVSVCRRQLPYLFPDGQAFLWQAHRVGGGLCDWFRGDMTRFRAYERSGEREQERAEMDTVTERVCKGLIGTWCLNGLRGFRG